MRSPILNALLVVLRVSLNSAPDEVDESPRVAEILLNESLEVSPRQGNHSLDLSFQCIAFYFDGGPSLLLFYRSPKFVIHTLPFRGPGSFFFIPLLLLPLPFTCIPCIIFPTPLVAFFLLVIAECVSSSRAGSLFSSGGGAGSLFSSGGQGTRQRGV